jgi:hypothetical protein
MNLLTKAQTDQLIQNGKATHGGVLAIDFHPVAKLFQPDGAATWLLTELMPDDPDLAFGLCDLGVGYPELGYVRLSELDQCRGKTGLPVERDRHFKAECPVSQYLAEAQTAQHVSA